MLKIQGIFSSFAVNDLAKSKEFYEKTLGLKVGEEKGMGLNIGMPGGGTVFVYPKGNHEPAIFTVLNFDVADIDEAVDELIARGVSFENYEGFHQDDKGIARGFEAGKGPDIAWFKDPSGNIFSVIKEK